MDKPRLHIRVLKREDGHAVALFGDAIGRVCRIASYPTRLEAVNRAILEEQERGVPFIVEEVRDAG